MFLNEEMLVLLQSTWGRYVTVRVHSHRSKSKTKANIFFDVWNFFFDLFRWFYDLFHFRVCFYSVWIDPKQWCAKQV